MTLVCSLRQPAKSLYSCKSTVISGKDCGSPADKKRLKSIISSPLVTVWYGVAFEASDDAKLRMCAHLRQLAQVISDSDGTLMVDLGHNGKHQNEAQHPWDTLSAVLTYHQVQICNLGITDKHGVPLSRKLHLLISKHRTLPDLSSCKCAGHSKKHSHDVCRQTRINTRISSLGCLRLQQATISMPPRLSD